jgi:hypothetical protein
MSARAHRLLSLSGVRPAAIARGGFSRRASVVGGLVGVCFLVAAPGALAFGPPTAQINSPVDQQTFSLNAQVPTSFSCTDSPGGPGIISCVDSTGGSGSPDTGTGSTGSGLLDTSGTTLLQSSYTVTATSIDGQTATATINYGVANLSPSPGDLQFGTRDMHSQSTMQETYFNDSATPTTVTSSTITGNDASSYSIQPGQDSCTGQTIPAHGSCSLQVVFSALASGPGPKAATLELVDDVPQTVDVQLSGDANTGTLSVSQSSLDFGAAVVNRGDSGQQSVTVTDGFNASTVVNNQQITGPDASSFSVQGGGCVGFTLGAGNTCQIFIQFQPTSAGTKHATLQIDNDGTATPLFVSLTGDGLNGPGLTVSPAQAIYGNVALGSQASQTFTLTNSGDAPLQIQALFMIAGSPQVFPISGDGCSRQQLAPGASCQATVGFIPIATGGKDASLFLITNASDIGVTAVGLSGTGVVPSPAPNGTATVTGTAQDARVLTCTSASYPSGTSFAYQWLRNGKPVMGATRQKLLLTNVDVGAVLSCRVKATSPGGSQTVTSRGTTPTLPELTTGKVSVHDYMINANVTASGGRLVATSLITNGQTLASRLRIGRCKAARMLASKHRSGRCGFSSFSARILTIHAGGTYTVRFSPNVAAKMALNSGQTLHVKATLTLTARGLIPVRKTFTVAVHGKDMHKKH